MFVYVQIMNLTTPSKTKEFLGVVIHKHIPRLRAYFTTIEWLVFDLVHQSNGNFQPYYTLVLTLSFTLYTSV